VGGGTDDEFDVLLGNVAALVESGNGAAALRMLDDGLEHVLECAYLAGHAYVELDDAAAALVQLLAAEDLTDEALADLQEIRPAFEQRYGPGSVHVRNLDRQADRLRHPDARNS
jgi:hypothetical protein